MDVEQLYEEAISLVENQDTIDSVMEIEDQSVVSERLISIIKTGRAVEDDEGADEDTAERVRNLKFSSITAMRKSIGVADDEWTAAWKKTPSRTHHNELVAKTLAGMTAGERAKAFEAVSPADKPSTSTAPKSGGIPSAPLASEIAEALLAATKHQLTEALANSADPKIKKEHIASAKMIRVVMESGGGLPTPSSKAAVTPFNQQKFQQALLTSDRKTWLQMLADHKDVVTQVLKLAKGKSATLNELMEAAQAETPQGANTTALVAWVDQDPVSEPRAEWDGPRPRTRSKRLPAKYRNTILPLQFTDAREGMVSDILDEVEYKSAATKYDSDSQKSIKDLEAFDKARKEHRFKTTQDFRDAIDLLEEYCANTEPALMPEMSEELRDHRTYVRALTKEMNVQGANANVSVMTLYVRYDEAVRIKRAEATMGTSWTDDFQSMRMTYLTIPLQKLTQRRNEETAKKLASLEAELKTVRQRPPPGGGGGGGGGSLDRVWDRVKDIPGVKREHLKVKGKDICAGSCRGKCQFGQRCRFGHHCIKCGSTAHATPDCK
jgi:hypothetical protein